MVDYYDLDEGLNHPIYYRILDKEFKWKVKNVILHPQPPPPKQQLPKAIIVFAELK
jgi:hypothetical protein